jgi:hypothetical protein
MSFEATEGLDVKRLPRGSRRTLYNMRKQGVRSVIACVVMILMATARMTGAFAFSPADCGIEAGPDKAGLPQYCARLRQNMIASDPGHGLIGTLEKADPIEGEPASQHYYWIQQTYFDGNSSIGRKILKACTVGRLCAIKVGVEKSWEHNLSHATFWITKIVGEPIGE